MSVQTLSLTLSCVFCSILVAESYSDSRISFSEDTAAAAGTLTHAVTGRTNSETWEPLEKLAKGEVLTPLQPIVSEYINYVLTFYLLCLLLLLLGLAALVPVHPEEVRGAQAGARRLARQVRDTLCYCCCQSYFCSR